jgi:hypothetical protein
MAVIELVERQKQEAADTKKTGKKKPEKTVTQ